MANTTTNRMPSASHRLQALICTSVFHASQITQAQTAVVGKTRSVVLAASAVNGGEQEPMSLTAAKLPDGHSGPASVVSPG